jgi:hypothetical protein
MYPPSSAGRDARPQKARKPKRDKERRLEAEEPGAEVEEGLQFIPVPSFLALVKSFKGTTTFDLSVVISLVRSTFLGEPRAEGMGSHTELCAD